MNKKILVAALTAMVTLVFGAGIANALPSTLTDSTGTSVYTSTQGVPVNPNVNPTFGYNAKPTGGGAEHIYQDRPADVSYGPHGKFTTDTNSCGRCHQLHQANTARLIRFNIASNPNVQNVVYGICTYCHNFNGQSTYDVKDGMIWDAADKMRYATNGGGFERQLVVEGPASLATLVSANSSHQVNKTSNGLTTGTEYRYNAPGGNSGEHFALKCSSCHNPHGSANARILVEKISANNANVGNGTIVPRATGATINEFVSGRFGDEVSNYSTEISKFCGSCHTDYLNTANDGSTLSSGKYRHKINMAADNDLNQLNRAGSRNDGTFGYDATTLQLPLGTTDVTPLTGGPTMDQVVCTTCHFAHGTGAEITKDIVAASNPANDAAKQRVDTNGGSAYYLLNDLGDGTWGEKIKNLRMDNRAVCQNCHNRNSYDATAPALAGVVDPAATGALTYKNTAKLADKAKFGENTAGTNYVIIRFDQYMAKAAAENEANYAYRPLGGANPTEAVAEAILMPDGRTVQLKVTTEPTLNTSTITTLAGLKNINNIATAGEAATIK